MLAKAVRADKISVSAVLKGIASPRLTVLFFLLMAASVLAVKERLLLPTEALFAPFGLLVLNLGAAIITHPRFRGDLPLLVLHLCLLAIITLFAVGRLTYMYGAVSVTRGTVFDGVVDRLDHGPLHNHAYRDLKFVHARSTERFNDSVGHHIEIRNILRSQNAAGRWNETELRFGYPIIINGYRIYPSGRRGYVAIFEWVSNSGQRDLGAVQLFGTGEEIAENSNNWTMPNGKQAWLLLEKHVPGPPPIGTVRTDLDSASLPHHLVLRYDDTRHEIRLGDELPVPGGVLTYVKLESWGGYSLIYDPTEPWLIAAILVGVGALGVFYFRRFSTRQKYGDDS